MFLILYLFIIPTHWTYNTAHDIILTDRLH